jgi:D-alanyl-D-alanine carboxypeptidase
VAPTRSGTAAASPDLEQTLEQTRSLAGAPGIVAVVRIDGSEHAAAVGDADLVGTPLEANATFRIASITKPIVAALVLAALDDELVTLDTPVAPLVPGLIRDEPPITLRQLLSHTSGFFDEGNDGDPIADVERLSDPALKVEAADVLRRYQAGEHPIASDRLLIALAETHGRYFEPGTDYHYSNTGYQLAGLLLEQATGSSLDELLADAFVDPLGLTSTTIAPPDRRSPDMRGYVPGADGSAPVDVTDDLLAFGNGGNGGIVSTAPELLSMLRAIVSGRVLTPETTATMRTPIIGTYGLGIASYALPCGVFFGHEGLVNGTQSIALVDASGEDGLVIAVNLVRGAGVNLRTVASSLVCPAD